MFFFVEVTPACSKKSWNFRGIHINRDACIVLRIKLKEKLQNLQKRFSMQKEIFTIDLQI
jgi:hypothetical protein